MNTKYLKRWLVLLAALLLLNTVFARQPRRPSGIEQIGVIAVADLPSEAQKTLVLVKHGGPFRYPKDGVVFGNYERILPQQSRGYYHEFTVSTPGTRNRGARRLIVGGKLVEPREFFYTADHYASFVRITE